MKNTAVRLKFLLARIETASYIVCFSMVDNNSLQQFLICVNVRGDLILNIN